MENTHVWRVFRCFNVSNNFFLTCVISNCYTLSLSFFLCVFLLLCTQNTRCCNEWINVSCKNATLLVFPIYSPNIQFFSNIPFFLLSFFLFFLSFLFSFFYLFFNPPSLSSLSRFPPPLPQSPPECQSRPGGAVHQAGANRQGLVRRGVQRHRQSHPESGGHQDHRPRRGGRWDWGHPAGDHSAESVRQPLRHQVLRFIPKGDASSLQVSAYFFFFESNLQKASKWDET